MAFWYLSFLIKGDSKTTAEIVVSALSGRFNGASMSDSLFSYGSTCFTSRRDGLISYSHVFFISRMACILPVRLLLSRSGHSSI